MSSNEEDFIWPDDVEEKEADVDEYDNSLINTDDILREKTILVQDPPLY